MVPSQPLPSHWLEAFILLSTSVVEPLVPPQAPVRSVLSGGPQSTLVPSLLLLLVCRRLGAWTRTQAAASNTALHSSLATALSLSGPTGSLSRRSSPLPISVPVRAGPLVLALYWRMAGPEGARRHVGVGGELTTSCLGEVIGREGQSSQGSPLRCGLPRGPSPASDLPWDQYSERPSSPWLRSA